MLSALGHAFKAFRRAPLWSAATVITLGVAISLVTTLFIVISRVADAPLAVGSPSQLSFVYAADRGRATAATYSELTLLEEQTRDRLTWAAAQQDSTTIAVGVDRLQLHGERTTNSYFEILQVQLSLGRAYARAADRMAERDVVVISDGLWRRQFARAPDIVGRTLALTSTRGEKRHYTIIGVVAPSFHGVLNPWRPADYWVPVESRIYDLLGGDRPDALTKTSFEVLIGRSLESGGTTGVAAAVSQWVGLLARSSGQSLFPREAYQRTVRSSRAVGLPFDVGAGGPENVIRFLWLIGAGVFAIGLLNLTGLFVSRAVARRGEIRTRVVLGASMKSIGQQLVSEAALVSICAGALALVLGPIVSATVLRQIPLGPSAWFTEELVRQVSQPDAATVLFIALVCLTATAVLGLVPMRDVVTMHFSAAGRSDGASASQRLSKLLTWGVAAPQSMVATALLMVAGSAIVQWHSVSTAALGYRTDGIVSVRLDPPEEPLPGVFSFLEALRNDPDVAGAVVTNALPSSPREGLVVAESRIEHSRAVERVNQGSVTDGYFALLDIPIEVGRDFVRSDLLGEPRVAVIDKSLADRLWPDEFALGRRLSLGSLSESRARTWLEVVGVVGSVSPPVPAGLHPGAIYLPARGDGREDMALIKVRGAISTTNEIARRHISLAGEGSGILSAATLNDAVALRRYPYRVVAVLLTSAGIAGLGLAILGILAVAWYGVSRRFKEFGIRAALGADEATIVQQVVLEMVRVGVVSSVAGIACGVALMRVIGHHIQGVGSVGWEHALFAFATVNFSLLLAMLRPAVVASRANPVTLLRTD